MDARIWNDMFDEAMRRGELVTLPELEAAAHRQGFASLAEVERAVLESTGTISFVGRQPSPETMRHEELLRRLDGLGREVTALRAALAARP